MKILEVIKVAFVSLRSNKLRSSLTILGIVVGLFSIIAISTIVEMLQKSIENMIKEMDINKFKSFLSSIPADRKEEQDIETVRILR